MMITVAVVVLFNGKMTRPTCVILQPLAADGCTRPVCLARGLLGKSAIQCNGNGIKAKRRSMISIISCNFNYKSTSVVVVVVVVAAVAG